MSSVIRAQGLGTPFSPGESTLFKISLSVPFCVTCTTGCHRMLTTKGYPTKTESHNSFTKYIETNTKRELKWRDKETPPNERKGRFSKKRAK